MSQINEAVERGINHVNKAIHENTLSRVGILIVLGDVLRAMKEQESKPSQEKCTCGESDTENCLMCDKPESKPEPRKCSKQNCNCCGTGYEGHEPIGCGCGLFICNCKPSPKAECEKHDHTQEVIQKVMDMNKHLTGREMNLYSLGMTNTLSVLQNSPKAEKDYKQLYEDAKGLIKEAIQKLKRFEIQNEDWLSKARKHLGE